MREAGVLAVDLDGTLIKSDMLLESWWSVLARDHVAALRALFALRDGKAAFKAVLAERAVVDVASLPYNDEVLALIAQRREAGDQVILATASDHRFAEEIAAHLGCFDAVLASDGARNLGGAAKAEALVADYGARGFDYAGDAPVDVAIWEQARGAVTVGANAALRRAAEDAAETAEHIDAAPNPGAMPPWLRAIRPHQWLKNILVFLPVIAAHSFAFGDWFAALIAFISFSFVASSVYLWNDLLDLSADRAHPRKRFRPLASGAMKLIQGSLLAPGLLLAGVLLAAIFAKVEFLGVLAVYFALTTAYSLSLKRKLVIDICVLAGLYTLRVFAGGAATGIALSPWILAFSIFLFLSLAAVKRQAELVSDQADGREGASGRAYVTSDLPIVAGMALASGYLSVLILALYLNSPEVAQLYGSPVLLWGVCPILLYWISRTVMLAHRGHMTDDPIVFALRDRISRYCGVLIVAVAVAGTLL